ncbi:MAG: VWA domain-containing protein, partial [Anaerolineae bacterium]|nr:VWA domain-containing protein [Anaerolineae bacterium]
QAQGADQLVINGVETEGGVAGFWVRAHVSVLDSENNPISGLGAADFALFEDGEQVEVESVEIASTGLAVVLVVDISGSMNEPDASGQRPIDLAKEAAERFVRALDEEDEVAIYAFNENVSLLLDFTFDHGKAINEGVFKLEADRGWTCLYDAAYEAVKKAGERKKGRRAVVLLTDGIDQKSLDPNPVPCSIRTREDLVELANDSVVQVPIYTIGLGPFINAADLEYMSMQTRGRALVAPTASELDKLFQTIARQLKRQYVVTYWSQAPLGEHLANVKIEHRGATKGDSIRWAAPSVLPVIKVTGPGKAEGIVTYTADVWAQTAVTQVEFYVDTRLQDTDDSRPYEFRLDAATFPAGRVEIIGKAYTSDEQTCVSAGLEVEVIHGDPTLVPTSPPNGGLSTKNPALYIAVALLGIAILGGGVFLLLRRRGKGTETGPIDDGGLGDEDEFGAWPDQEKWDEDDKTQDFPDHEMTIDEGYEADMAGPAAAKLTVVRSMELSPGDEFLLYRRTYTIGRREDTQIHIPDKPVSRDQAEIRFQRDSFYIFDSGSTYGTFVSDQRVSSDGQRLRDKDLVRLGTRTVLRFEESREAGPQYDSDSTQDVGSDTDGTQDVEDTF